MQRNCNPLALPDLYYHWPLRPEAYLVIRVRSTVSVASFIQSQTVSGTGSLKQNATGTDYRTLPPCFD